MKYNPKSTQDFLLAIKSQEEYMIDLEGIQIQLSRNVFPPQSSTSISSQGLLDIAGGVAGKSVLDMGTGSGIQAIRAVKAGAQNVTAVDISTAAVSCALKNSLLNKCGEKMIIQQGDLFENIDIKEKFDVIIANLPFLDYPLYGVAESALYDPDMKIHHRLFRDAKERLTTDGVIIMPHANMGGEDAFAKLETMIQCYDYKIIGKSEKFANGCTWRVYKLTK